MEVYRSCEHRDVEASGPFRFGAGAQEAARGCAKM